MSLSSARTRVAAALAIGLAFILTIPASASAGPMNAYGTWRDNGGKRAGVWQADLQVVDHVLSGTITVSGWQGGEPHRVAGTVNSPQIQFGLLYSDHEEASFAGTLAGDKANGSFARADGISGTWTGRWVAK
jgi:hypothetical protein